MARRNGVLTPITQALIYASTFFFCLLGAVGVVTVVTALILVDVVVGVVRGDFKARVSRPRW